MQQAAQTPEEPDAHVRPRAGVRARLVPWVAYAVLALVVTWPLALDPAGSFVGGARSDAQNTLWGFWFVARALGEGSLPLHTTLLDHPGGGRILVADPLNSLLAVPLTCAWGPTVAWAVIAPLHVALAGRAAHALATRLGGNGWVAGVGYACAPIVLSHLQNGSSEAVSAGWLPLAALALLSALEHGGGWRVTRAGLALTACALSGWYAGVGAFLLAGSAAVVGALDLALGERAARFRLGRALAVLAVGVTLTAPMAAGIQALARADDGLVEIKGAEDLARLRRTLGAADPRAFVLPGDFRAPDFAALVGNPSDRVHTTYLGWTLLAAAAWAAWRDRREDRSALAPRVWGLAGAVAAVLALGPVVTAGGMPLEVAGRALPLPYALLERLPGFASLSLLYRLATLSALALALLASRVQGRAAWALIPAFLLEVRLASPVAGLPDVSPLPESPALEALARAPAGAVVNLPVVAGRNYLWEQTVHGKPFCGSLNSGANRAALRVVRAARELRTGEGDLDALVATARAEGVRYVVVHQHVLADELFVGAITALRKNVRPLSDDGRVVVYSLW